MELTGRRAQVVIHEADAPLLRSRRAHVDEYLAGRGQYLDGDAAKVAAATEAVISGEMEPTMLLKGGETLSLGGDVTVSVHAIPGTHQGQSRTSSTAKTRSSSATRSRCTGRPTASQASRTRPPIGRAWSTCATRSVQGTST